MADGVAHVLLGRQYAGFPLQRTCAACAMVMAVAITGCSFVPTYQRPAIAQQVDRFDGAPNQSLDTTIPVGSGWWHSFQDPVLDGLMAEALRSNMTLASAVASVKAAQANAEQAGAPLFPTIALSGNVGRGNKPNSNTSNHSQGVYAVASYEFDFWGKHAATARSADLLADASSFDRDTVALTLTASVANTYFQVQSLRERLAIARDIEADANHILQLLLAQQAVGVASALQIEQQRNAVATFDATVPALEQQYQASLHMLAVLTGVPPEKFTVPERSLAAISLPEVRPTLPSQLLEARPDIASKEMQLRSAYQSVGAARAAFLPNVPLTFNGGFFSEPVSQLFSKLFGTVSATLNAPIFDGGVLTGQLHASQATLEKDTADYKQTVLAALQDVEDALSAAQSQRRVVQADTVATAAALRAHALAQSQYQFGTVDFLTVLVAQRTLYTAQDALAQAQLARLQASVGLFRAFGGGMIVTNGTPDNPSPSSMSEALSPNANRGDLPTRAPLSPLS